MVLLLDNYDSFSYNLYQMAGVINPDIQVIKNDAITAEEAESLGATHLIISPGPGRPRDAGICEELVLRMAGKVPMLGICLGHQAICEAFGGEVTYAAQLMHGKKSAVHVANGNPVFRGLPPMVEAARYHSLAAKRDKLPDELLVIAEDSDGEVMGVKHRDYHIYGLQFHPESILTTGGDVILRNFLSLGGGK